MRILFGTQVSLEQSHGGARHVLAVARQLRRLGHELALLAPGHEPEPIDGVRRIRPPYRGGPGLRMEAALAAAAAPEVLRAVPHVAYLRLSATSSLLPRSVRRLGVPIVLELNGRILEELRQLGRSEVAVRTVSLNLRRIIRQAEAVVAVEPNIAAHAKDELGARDVHVVLNGADIDIAVPGPRDVARERLGLPMDRPIIAFAGSLVPELRLDLLFEALTTVDALFVVAGDGPQGALVRQHAARFPDRVHFLGSRPHAEAVALLQAADVCVNVRDGDLGMKALEYAAVGRRMVVFDVAGSERLSSLYPEDRAVFRVVERSGSALAATLRSALCAEAEDGPLPEAAVDRARESVSWRRTAEQIEGILEAARRR